MRLPVTNETIVVIGMSWNRDKATDLSPKKHYRTPITDAQYRAGYVWGRRVWERKQANEPDYSKTAAEELVALGINETSAAYMIVITDGLLSGKLFKRALKEEAYGWYLGWIFDDFGPDALRTALGAARLHLEYRESDGGRLPRFRAEIEAKEAFLSGAGSTEERGKIPAATESARANEARWSMVLARYGQPEFRSSLIAAYKGKCAVSGTSVERVLEAAHIKPYSAAGESKVSNGLLLRSDIHALFDAHLLSVDPKSLLVRVSRSLKDVPEYWKFDRVKLNTPEDPRCEPDRAALQDHFRNFV